MDEFVNVWSSIREKYLDDDAANLTLEYKRCAVAFTWCDADRNIYNKDEAKVWEAMNRLRNEPASLTTRMFVVANGANAFIGVDDETKKNSKALTKKVKKDAGNGDSLSPKDSPAA